MIVVKLQGGLGNQMFQYAFARSLSLRTGQPFILDAVALLNGEGITRRHYSLDVFDINPRLTTKNEPVGFLQTYTIIKESPSLSMSDVIRHASKNTYYDGYWQSDKYFCEYEKIIHTDFVLKNQLSEQASIFASEMSRENSIAIQVRRGDYVSNKKVANLLGACDIDYYQRAATHLAKDPDIQLYVISDDIAWCKNNLVFPWKTVYISEYDLPDFEELFLITCAKHVIISNSSFGWWGAWLNKNKEKIVITPKKWFRDVSMEKTDIVPGTWLRL